MAGLPRNFVDICVIYQDVEVEGNWIAHSINTDHVAVGNCVLNAYVELEEVLNRLLREASRDKNIQFMSSAPQEIIDKLKHARPLPKELLEIAELRRNGKNKGRKPGKPPWGGRVRTLRADLEMAV